MKVYELLVPFGAAAYIALAAAFLTGLLKFKFHLKWVNPKWHIRAGALAMIFASLHLAIFIR